MNCVASPAAKGFQQTWGILIDLNNIYLWQFAQVTVAKLGLFSKLAHTTLLRLSAVNYCISSKVVLP